MANSTREGTSTQSAADGVLPILNPVEATPGLPLRDSEEIQGDILAGFNKDHRTFLFLRFPADVNRARSYLQELIPRIAKTKDVASFNARFSNARRLNGGDDPQNMKAQWVNVSLTHHGLTTLDSSLDNDLQNFAFALREGPQARADFLGDTGLSAPSRWVFGRDEQQIDVLLSVAADDPNDLLLLLDKQRALASKHGLIIVFEQRGDTLPDGRAGHEHFGFKDGISQPGVRGFDPPNPANDEVLGRPGTKLIDAAQFVIGLEGNAQVPDAPGWMKNGSFQVFRRLSQDVAGFWAQVTANRQSLPSDDPMTEDLLAAKLVGRWRSGTPLEIAPDNDDRSTRDPGNDNDFNFDNDPDGHRCPHFAHIRKVYPRNDAAFGDKTRRIIRRGIPFGEPFDPASGRGHGVDAQRGLLFNAYMASIENQFEFLQSTWANNAFFPGEGTGPDPIIGDVQPRPSANTIRRENMQDVELDFRRFVHTSGALYAFAPSISTLQRLASGSSGGLQVGGTAIVNGNGLRLRDKPSLQGKVLGQFNTGTRLTLLEGPTSADGHNWWRVRTPDNREGWVAGTFLRPA